MKVNRLLICSMAVTAILVALPVQAAVDPETIMGIWLLDESDVVTDQGPYGYHGGIAGDPISIEGPYGNGISLDGVDDLLTVENPTKILELNDTITITVWLKGSGPTGWPSIVNKDRVGGVGWRVDSRTVDLRIRIDTSAGGNQVRWLPGTAWDDDQWHHIAWVLDSGTIAGYLDGEKVNTEDTYQHGDGFGTSAGNIHFGPIGLNNAVEALDDIGIFGAALEADDIKDIFALGLSDALLANETAGDPQPADGAIDVPRDVQLRWSPGEFANTHTVYFDEVREDVNDATPTEAMGTTVAADLSDTAFDPGRLGFGQTYHWRVDEINSAPDFTVYKGDIWSFTTEPYSIPITDVTATASSAFGVSVPENTVNGSGLVDDLHGTSASDMWISAGLPATIEYVFDAVYKLDELWVWNSNQLIESFVGFGAKDVVIEHSLDGESWSVLEGVGPLAQAAGAEGYAANNVIEFGGAVAQYVRITISTAQGLAPQTSLSEVRFFAIPTTARQPQPADGEINVDPSSALLTWRSGRDADRHEVYLDTDQATTLVATVAENQYQAAPELGRTYAWKVHEVNDTEDMVSWESDTWQFTTADYIVVDDMESYADAEFKEIWATWVDGFEEAGNGSLVGNGASGTPEMDIVHGGGQALPIHFDNSAAPLSEATRTFVETRDWTQYGISTLVVYFRGALGNSGGQLYAMINGQRVTFDGSADALSQPFWRQWNINLATIATDLSRVGSVSVGVEGAGAQGVVYVDDLHLYREAPEAETPTAPGSANLVAHFAFENNTNDSSGNGNNGTAVGNLLYDTGVQGSALRLNGIDSHVSLGTLDIVGQITLMAWVKPTGFVYNDTRIISKTTSGSANDHLWMLSTNGNNHVLRFRLKTDNGENTTTLVAGGRGLQLEEWAHVAATWDGSTMRVYQDLDVVGSADKTGTAVAVDPAIAAAIGNQPEGVPDNDFFKHWEGLVDEVRIYDRALASGELLHTAAVP